MSKKQVSTVAAPAAIGPYSQAVKVGATLYCSGQIPLDPNSGTMVDGGIEEQTTQVMDNLAAVLNSAGCGWNDVVKTTIYLVDLGAFAQVNTIYGQYFDGMVPPARATVQVAALPKGALVEIDAVAVRQEK